MDDKTYLLTYDCLESRGGDNLLVSTYAWFETEDELFDFIEEHKADPCFCVNDAIKIRDCYDLIESEE